MPGTEADEALIRELEERLSAMQESMSWRITAPLRRILGVVRSARRGFGVYDRSKALAIATERAVPSSEFKEAEALRVRLSQLAPSPKRSSEQAILILDHSVPKPDQDAGSRAIMDVILSLRAENWQVLFWPQDRHWDETYTSALERQGVRVLDDRVPVLLPQWLRAHGAVLDQVMVSRASVAEACALSLAAGTTAPLIFYGHDIASFRMAMHAELTGDAELQAEAQRYLSLERRVWRLFDRVIYLSEEEAAAVRRLEPYADARSIVPFAYDSFTHRDVPPLGETILFVGGFAHAPNRDAARFLVCDVLPLVQLHSPKARVVLAGSQPGPEIKALAGPSVSVTGWISEADLAVLYRQSRLAAVPLRFGAGVKGKLLEALQQGLPTVVTPVGVQGLPGLEAVVPVCETAQAMASAILTLLHDDASWIAQSAGQTAYAAQRFSRVAMQASLLSAFGPPPQPPRGEG